MLSRSKYQQPCSTAEDAWKYTYLAQDVEALQQQKQHHLHMADKQGVQQPLNHGRDPKDPTKKKSTSQGTGGSQTRCSCPVLVQHKRATCPGRASEAWLACRGALAMTQTCMATTLHRWQLCSAECKEHCHLEMPPWQLVKEAQTNQAAQTGDACDYQNKRLPIAVHEVKAWMKGQKAPEHSSGRNRFC